MGAAIPQTHWVAVLPSHLDDKARDVYKELTGARCSNQMIPWHELADLFEVHFQEKVNLNNALLMLKAMKFDHTKGDFTEFSTRFFDVAAKAYHKFDPAALDFAASTALRDKLPQAWLNKLDEAHNEDPSRIAFSYDQDVCQLLQDTERACSESQWLYSELNKKDDAKTEPKKNFKGQPMFNTDTAPPNNKQNDGQCGGGQRKGRGNPPSAFQEFLPDIGLQQMDKQVAPFDNGGARG